MGAGTGLIWLRIGTGGLMNAVVNFQFACDAGSFPRLAAELLASQEVLFFMEFTYANMYEGWNFNSGNYLFTTDTK